MSNTKWAVDGGEGTVLEVGGRKFGMNDDGAPMLCSMYCRSMGRHAHIDWCRTDDHINCGGPEHEHIAAPMQPEPRKAKDWITHGLYWRRTGLSTLSIFSSKLFVHHARYPGFKGGIQSVIHVYIQVLPYRPNQTHILKTIRPTSQNGES